MSAHNTCLPDLDENYSLCLCTMGWSRSRKENNGNPVSENGQNNEYKNMRIVPRAFIFAEFLRIFLLRIGGFIKLNCAAGRSGGRKWAPRGAAARPQLRYRISNNISFSLHKEKTSIRKSWPSNWKRIMKLVPKLFDLNSVRYQFAKDIN